MRDRLIELLSTAGWNLFTDNRCKAEIADHLLANGVVVLPCKVGDTVWFETFKNNGRDCVGIQPHTIDRVDIDFVVGAKKLIETKIPDFWIGKYVFLTKAEAEQALKDMRKEQKKHDSRTN